MRHARVYTLVIVMWALMIAGGGIAVNVLGPLHASDEAGEAGVSAAKAAVAVGLVVAWVWVLSRIKSAIFSRRRA
ncbi:MAG: hypothetical protein OXU37_04965 [Thaumarchaeota archaeon]|nr:hypothetical protein [Nitrososphaerota archaeon]